MVKRIIVSIKTVDGKVLIHPIDKGALQFAAIKQAETLTLSDLIIIEDLGFEIEYQRE